MRWQDSYNDATDYVRWTMIDAFKVRDTQKGKAELRACAAAMTAYRGRGE